MCVCVGVIVLIGVLLSEYYHTHAHTHRFSQKGLSHHTSFGRDNRTCSDGYRTPHCLMAGRCYFLLYYLHLTLDNNALAALFFSFLLAPLPSPVGGKGFLIVCSRSPYGNAKRESEQRKGKKRKTENNCLPPTLAGPGSASR